MRLSGCRLFCVLALASGFSPALAQAQDATPQEDDKAIISAVFENDLFANTDQNYTNGLRLSWLSSENRVPVWVKDVSHRLFPYAPQAKKRIGISVGQNMYTPRDLTRRDLIVDDRPYAGWLYGSIGVVSDTGSRLDNAMLTLGVVGPASYARQTQRFVHRVVDSTIPQGWDNQLENEPGIVLTWERKWRALYQFSPFGAGVDISPHIGANLGNIFTDAAAGATVRLGFDLPADYGPPRIRPSLPGSDFFVPTQEIGGYLFAGAEGRVVGRNIFLDGNSFRDSHDVDKRYGVGSLQAGAALTYESMRLSYTHVFMTREFKGQAEAPQFGALTLSVRF